MKLLVSTDLVAQRMALDPSITANESALESAIIAAQMEVERALMTLLSERQNSDIFHCDASLNAGVQLSGFYRLRLRNGFVRVNLTQPMTLLSGTTWNNVTSIVPSTEYYFDASMGVIYLSKNYDNQYVKVDYWSGFSSQIELPDWLREAIISFTPSIFNFAQPTNRSAEAEKQFQMSQDHARAVLAPHIRNIPYEINPLF